MALPRILVLAAALSAVPAAALAQQQPIFPGQAPPKSNFTSPDRGFSVDVPTNWIPKSFPDQPDFVEFRIEGPGDAWLQVRRLKVPSGARPRQLLSRAVEFRLSKLPHYTELKRRDVNMGGANGASVLATFWYQGNAEYPRAFEEIYLVIGNEAFEFHFECFEPMAQHVAGALDSVYRSFIAHPAAPSAQGPADDEDPLDKIPF